MGSESAKSLVSCLFLNLDVKVFVSLVMFLSHSEVHVQHSFGCPKVILIYVRISKRHSDVYIPHFMSHSYVHDTFTCSNGYQRLMLALLL